MRSRETLVSLLLGLAVLSVLGIAEARAHGKSATGAGHDEPYATMAAAVGRSGDLVVEAPAPDGPAPYLVRSRPAIACEPSSVAGHRVCIPASTPEHPLYLRSVVLLL